MTLDRVQGVGDTFFHLLQKLQYYIPKKGAYAPITMSPTATVYQHKDHGKGKRTRRTVSCRGQGPPAGCRANIRIRTCVCSQMFNKHN